MEVDMVIAILKKVQSNNDVIDIMVTGTDKSRSIYLYSFIDYMYTDTSVCNA